MEHVVFFPGPDGSPAFRRTGSLEEAVRFVEHLRNAEGVTEVSVHALSAVPLAFRTYVKVELPAGEAAAEPLAEAVAEPAESVEAVAQVAEAAAEPVAEPVADAVPVEAVPVEAVPVLAEELVPAARVEEPSVNGRRSLGFFAS